MTAREEEKKRGIDWAFSTRAVGPVHSADDSLNGRLVALYWTLIGEDCYLATFEDLLKPVGDQALPPNDDQRLEQCYDRYLRQLKRQQRLERKLDCTRFPLFSWLLKTVLYFVKLGLNCRAKRCHRVTNSVFMVSSRSSDNVAACPGRQ
jgi:hypothetical protein